MMETYRPQVFFRFYTAKVLANLGAFAFIPFLPLYLTERDAGIVQVGIFFSALAVARLAFGLVGGWLADTIGHLRGLALGSAFGVGAFLFLIWSPTWGWVYAGIPVFRIGLIGTLAYAATLLSHSIAGWLVDRFGEKLPVMLSFALTGASILVFVGSSSWTGFAAGWALMGVTWGLGTTAYDSLISKTVPAARRGLAYGLFSTAHGFFSLPVPVIGGWLYLWGPAAPFVAAAGASILGAALVVRRFPGGRLAEAETGTPLTHADRNFEAFDKQLGLNSIDAGS